MLGRALTPTPGEQVYSTMIRSADIFGVGTGQAVRVVVKDASLAAMSSQRRGGFPCQGLIGLLNGYLLLSCCYLRSFYSGYCVEQD